MRIKPWWTYKTKQKINNKTKQTLTRSQISRSSGPKKASICGKPETRSRLTVITNKVVTTKHNLKPVSVWQRRRTAPLQITSSQTTKRNPETVLFLTSRNAVSVLLLIIGRQNSKVGKEETEPHALELTLSQFSPNEHHTFQFLSSAPATQTTDERS